MSKFTKAISKNTEILTREYKDSITYIFLNEKGSKNGVRLGISVTIFINLLVGLILYLVFHEIKQTKTFIDQYLEVVDFDYPLISAIMLCLLCFTLIIASRGITALKYGTNPEYERVPKDNTILIISYFLPLIPFLSRFKENWNWFVIFLIIALSVFMLLIRSKPILAKNVQSPENSNFLTFEKYRERLQLYALLALWAWMSIIIRLAFHSFQVKNLIVIIIGYFISGIFFALIITFNWNTIPKYFFNSEDSKNSIYFIKKTYANYRQKRHNLFLISLIIISLLMVGPWFIAFKTTSLILPIDVIIITLAVYRILLAAIYWSYHYIWQLIRKFNFGQGNFTRYIVAIIVTLLIGCIVVMNLFVHNDKYVDRFLAISTLETNNDSFQRETLNDYTTNWITQDTSDVSCIYLIAGEGGGSRAGFWTASCLRFLDSLFSTDSMKVEFYDNIFAISTASGSSVGASVYQLAKHGNGPTLITQNDLNTFFSTDFITASIFKLLLVNPFQKTLPIESDFLKGRNQTLMSQENQALDKLISSNDSIYLKTDFLSMKSDSSKRQPLLVLNSYNVTQKVKSIISPVIITDSTSEDFFSHMDLSKNSIGVAQAVNLSQMFPIASASSFFNESQYYDGGVYDNSGISTLRTIYQTLSQNRDELCPNRRIIVLYLQNHQSKKKPKRTTSNIGSLIKAATGSIFSANTKRHHLKFQNVLSTFGDTLLNVPYVYYQDSNKVYLNRWVSDVEQNRMLDSCSNICSKIADLIPHISQRNMSPKHYKYSVYFNTGKSTVKDYQAKELYSFFEHIKPTKITISGHTDRIGDQKDNVKLAKKRVRFVRTFLKDSTNIDASQIVFDTIIVGMDSCNYFEPADRQLCRRVDIEFLYYDSDKEYFPSIVGN